MPEISVILLPWDVMGISHFSYRNAFMSLKTSPRENMCSSLKSVLLIMGFLYIISGYTHPFSLCPCFLQFLEIWFEKFGSKILVGEKWFCKLWFSSWFQKNGWPEKRWVYTRNLPFFRLEKSGFANSIFFLVWEKWLTRKKKSSLQNHFSRTTLLHFSIKVVADQMANCNAEQDRTCKKQKNPVIKTGFSSR